MSLELTPASPRGAGSSVPKHRKPNRVVQTSHQGALSSLLPRKRQLLPQSCSLLLCSSQAGAHVLRYSLLPVGARPCSCEAGPSPEMRPASCPPHATATFGARPAHCRAMQQSWSRQSSTCTH